MPTLRRPTTQMDFNDLFIGNTKDGKEISLSDKSLLVNGLLVIGTKNSGKSSLVPNFFIQTINTPYIDDTGKKVSPVSNAGVTVVTSKRDQVFSLYAIAKKNHRTLTRLLKPSANFKLKNELLGMKEYDYAKINEFVDYTKAINDKEVILIDMENDAYEDAARRAVGMLLLQLQIAMHNTAATACRRHYLIIDDAYQYMPYLEYILRYGPEYNIIPVLFVDSREQLGEYKSIVDTNLQNLILMGNVSYDDAKHYAERFFLDSPRELIGNSREDVFCSFYDENMRLAQERCTISDEFYDSHEQELIATNAAKYRKALNKVGTDDEYVSDILKAYAYYVAAQQNTYATGQSFDSLMRVGREQTALMDEQPKASANKAETKAPVEKSKPLETQSVKIETPVVNKEDKSIAASEPVEQEDSSGATILPGIRQKAIDPSTIMKQRATVQQSREVAGIRALLGVAVADAPQRIQKRLEQEGLPVEELKKEKEKGIQDAMNIGAQVNNVSFDIPTVKTKEGIAPSSQSSSSKTKTEPQPPVKQSSSQSVDSTSKEQPKKKKKRKRKRKHKKKSSSQVTQETNIQSSEVKVIEKKDSTKQQNTVILEDAAKKNDASTAESSLPNKQELPVNEKKNVSAETIRAEEKVEPATETGDISQKENDSEKSTARLGDVKGSDSTEESSEEKSDDFTNDFPDYDDNDEDDLDEVADFSGYNTNQSFLDAYDDESEDYDIFAPPAALDEDIDVPDSAIIDSDAPSKKNDNQVADKVDTLLQNMDFNEKIDVFGAAEPVKPQGKLGLSDNLAGLSNIPKSSGESYNSYQKSFSEMVHAEGSKTGFFNSRRASELLKKNFSS